MDFYILVAIAIWCGFVAIAAVLIIFAFTIETSTTATNAFQK